MSLQSCIPTHVQVQHSKPKIINNYLLNKIMFNFSLIFSTYSEYTLYAYIPFRVWGSRKLTRFSYYCLEVHNQALSSPIRILIAFSVYEVYYFSCFIQLNLFFNFFLIEKPPLRMTKNHIVDIHYQSFIK